MVLRSEGAYRGGQQAGRGAFGMHVGGLGGRQAHAARPIARRRAQGVGRRRLSDDPYTGLAELSALYLAALIAAYGMEFTQTYLMQWTGQKVMFDLRREIFRHMQRMHIGFFDAHAVGRLVTRITSDVDAINEMFTAGVLAR